MPEATCEGFCEEVYPEHELEWFEEIGRLLCEHCRQETEWRVWGK